jgi:hypothetical protein
MEIIMNKFTFTVDIVTDSPVGIDTATIRTLLANAVDGIGSIAAVHNTVKAEVLKEQGFKVWRARVAGIKEAPKAKAPKAPKTKPTETVVA